MKHLIHKPQLQKQLANVPKNPGCYIFKDQDGQILYIGKAINLKNRVKSYFQKSTQHSTRISRMVFKVQSVDWVIVDNELEALVLECNLIKKHRPPYNVRMRDDKSYPYITITDEKFPRVLFTRRLTSKKAKYFGPYTSAYAVRETLNLLHKNLPLIPCGKSWSGKPQQRPCLYYHLGQCLGPCAGLSDPKEYKKVIDQVAKFLGGKGEDVLEGLYEKMEHASESQEYEKAAKYRDRIQAIQHLLQKQKVLSTDQKDRDVIAVVKDDGRSAVQMLYIRSGKLIGQRHFFLDGAKESTPSESIQEFVKQYYSGSPEVPKEILLPVDIEERSIVQQWLKGKKGSSVSITVPQKGEKLNLVDMAAKNAEQALSTFKLEMEQKEAWTEQAIGQLQEAIHLPKPPIRIEGFDISNIQGRSPVGSMVVTENGEPAKSEYRRFKIKTLPEKPNDFAMMNEVIYRRLKAYVDGDDKFIRLPDLMLIDGGKGQLMAALKARDELDLTVPMVGLAKRHEILYVPKGLFLLDEDQKNASKKTTKKYEYEAIELPLNSPGLMLLTKLRDEAHRFAITYHRKLRQSYASDSILDEIPGIGQRRKTILLRTFGSIDGLKKASLEDIIAVPTMTQKIAEQLYKKLRSAE